MAVTSVVGETGLAMRGTCEPDTDTTDHAPLPASGVLADIVPLV